MIYLGLRREDVDTADIHAATFHPFKDEWYIGTADEKGKPFIATFTGGVCSKIQMFSTANSYGSGRGVPQRLRKSWYRQPLICWKKRIPSRWKNTEFSSRRHIQVYGKDLRSPKIFRIP